MLVVVIAVYVFLSRSKTPVTTPASSTPAKGRKLTKVYVLQEGSSSSPQTVTPTTGSGGTTGSTVTTTTNPNPVRIVQPVRPTSTPSTTTTGAIAGTTSSGVPILSNQGTQAFNPAISQAKVNQLKSSQATSIPGVSSTIVAFDKNLARQNVIGGMTQTNVPIIQTHTPFAQAESLLASHQGVSIPGKTPAQVAYLQMLARQGKLTQSMLGSY